ncbi:peroxiredoxin type-2 [Paramarasmius palmivorus]|uniref:Putative peroxiredoxin n=1 Tax=Paramarasmius palmivorus TaxID=297713 RepID=A0AAW0CDH2_9AGAR
MANIKIGDTIPEGTFMHVPWTPDLESKLACGVPSKLDIHKEWKGKKVVLFSVPGAFTPTCHVNHLPGYLQNFQELKNKGVDVIAVLAANDPFVMSGWGKVNGTKDKILTLSDGNANWSRSLGLVRPDSKDAALGMRTARYALIIDDLVVKYIGVEPERGVTVSGVAAVLANL